MVPLNKDKAKIQDMLGLDHSEDMVDYFAKKSFFGASNANKLKIQIQTCLDLLEILLL